MERALHRAGQILDAKSRSLTESRLLVVGPSNPSAAAVAWRSIGKPVPASAAAPSGQRFIPRAGIDEAGVVARDHRIIRHQVVAQRHRLRRLEVGEAGHDAVGVFLGAILQRTPERRQRRQRLVDRVAHPQAEVGRDLVVAAARGCGGGRLPGRSPRPAAPRSACGCPRVPGPRERRSPHSRPQPCRGRRRSPPRRPPRRCRSRRASRHAPLSPRCPDATFACRTGSRH